MWHAPQQHWLPKRCGMLLSGIGFLNAAACSSVGRSTISVRCFGLSLLSVSSVRYTDLSARHFGLLLPPAVQLQSGCPGHFLCRCLPEISCGQECFCRPRTFAKFVPKSILLRCKLLIYNEIIISNMLLPRFLMVKSISLYTNYWILISCVWCDAFGFGKSPIKFEKSPIKEYESIVRK